MLSEIVAGGNAIPSLYLTTGEHRIAKSRHQSVIWADKPIDSSGPRPLYRGAVALPEPSATVTGLSQARLAKQASLTQLIGELRSSRPIEELNGLAGPKPVTEQPGVNAKQTDLNDKQIAYDNYFNLRRHTGDPVDTLLTAATATCIRTLNEMAHSSLTSQQRRDIRNAFAIVLELLQRGTNDV
jgi:hypothetical protein